MTVSDVWTMIDSLAPFTSQEDWDNSGLLVGSPSDPVTGLLFALDVTEPVIMEARRHHVSLLVTHHPLMFSPRRRITDDDCEGRLIQKLIRCGISLIAAHTNLDRAPGGINDTLAVKCGLKDISGEGFFRSGNLAAEMSVHGYSKHLENVLSCTVRILGPGDRMVRRIGLASGGGGDEWRNAAASGCDVFITGEIKHHTALEASDAGLVVMECGHFATEEPGIRALAVTLQNEINRLKCNVGVFVSEIPPYSFPQQP